MKIVIGLVFEIVSTIKYRNELDKTSVQAQTSTDNGCC